MDGVEEKNLFLLFQKIASKFVFLVILGSFSFFFVFLFLGSERKIKKLQELEKQLYSDSIFTMSLMKKTKLQLVETFI